MVSCCQLEFIFVNCVRGEGDRTKIQIWSFEEKPDSLMNAFKQTVDELHDYSSIVFHSSSGILRVH